MPGAKCWSAYRSLDEPGKHPLKDAQARLNLAVRNAYGMNETENVLSHLLKLNNEVAEREAKGKSVTEPGLPEGCDPKKFVTDDCITAPEPW